MTSDSRTTWARWVSATAFFFVVALIWCRPLHRYMFKGIPYEVEPHPGIEVVNTSPQDCLQLYYKYWLFSESATGRIPPFSDPYEFAVPGARGFTSQQFPVSVIFLLLKPISPVFAYNMIILLSFVACGLFMLKLAYAKTSDWGAAIIAGLVFAIIPFRPPQLMAGHPNGIAVCFVPLVLYLFDRALTTRSIAASVGTGLAFSSVALLDMQLAFFSAILIGFFALYGTAMGIFVDHKDASWQEQTGWFLRWVVPMAIGVLPGLAYLAFMKLVILQESAIHGAGASRGHIGPHFSDLWDITVMGERRIYIGPWVIGLSIAGLVLPVLTHPQGSRRLRRLATPLFWAAMVGVGLILSLSLNPPLNRVMDFIPMARLSRTPARATILTFSGLCLLTAFGLASIRKILGDRPYATSIYASLIAGTGLLIMQDYWLSGPRGINLLPSSSPVYERITSEAPEARVLATPIWPGDSAMSASLFHHIAQSRAHLLNGYSPVASSNYQDRVFGAMKHVNVGQFSNAEWQAARDLNVTHLTFHPESFPAPAHVSVFPAELTLARLMQTPALEWVMHSDPVDLFRVRPSPESFAIKAPATSPIGITVPGRYSSIEGTVIEDTDSIAGRVYVQDSPSTNAVFSYAGRIYPSGAYDVALRLKITPLSSATEVTWTLRAFLSEDGTTLASKTFTARDLPATGRYGWNRFGFELPQAGRVGFEMLSGSDARFTCDVWHMLFSDQRHMNEYEAEDCFHAGRVLKAEQASGRGVVQVNDRDPTVGIVAGPYRLFTAGTYVAEIRLRGTTPHPSEPAASIDVLACTSPLRPVRQELAKQEWYTKPQQDDFETVSIPFEITENDAIVGCSINRSRGAALEIDSLRIRPIDGETRTVGSSEQVTETKRQAL